MDASPEHRLVPITPAQRDQLEALERELRLRGSVVWADQLARICGSYDAEEKPAEARCERTDLDPHRPHHWRRRPDGSYGDYDDEGDLLWCPGDPVPAQGA